MKKYLISILLTLLSFKGIAAQEKKETTGKVSWYGGKFHGRRTASGSVYDKNALTCATTWNNKSKKLGFPFGTILKITNLANNKHVKVKVTDTGSFHKYGRILDLSKEAFKRIANINTGVIKVKVEVIKRP